ncbi:hypothetical protein GCM10007079_08740 [Nocardiopsis terrae]|nr:hypothetical protein GCM10007079_08740 [Nocardiopsis terrae]
MEPGLALAVIHSGSAVALTREQHPFQEATTALRRHGETDVLLHPDHRTLSSFPRVSLCHCGPGCRY